MHELSIAHSLAELALEEAEKLGVRRLRAVYLRLGVLSGIVKEALQFCFDVVVQDTPMEGAELIIEDVPVVVYCPQCQEERTLPEPLPMRCPVCGTRTAELLHGREVELYSLEGEEGDGKDASDCRDQAERAQEERSVGGGTTRAFS
ncbi:hydrogenase maturation nickel metallochaperone HypA [Kyrpidia tusciae]|uniref:hydrogenase maturation nickel metallochaperone HypA n=1 Tax=Kyrpidia tusciae TaxID=33943 RepID=UPI00030CD699|nr:hydrogenase maturation nickel metallochaperone HypA [Kyrpidia tusciae]MBE3551854.1 hydrogenase maturation nickel metallochaperone HypA [Kyrpidia tusciae]